MWFTEIAIGRIGRITPSGSIKEFKLPSRTSEPGGIAAGPGAYGSAKKAAGPSG
jgi:virginiamycin B lyase